VRSVVALIWIKLFLRPARFNADAAGAREGKRRKLVLF
jgi:hypothetical protein